MHYVARWRMHVALTWLKDEGIALGELASRLGYQSEAAFSRAFKRVMRVSPGAARRSRDAANAQYVTATERLGGRSLDPAVLPEAVA